MRRSSFSIALFVGSWPVACVSTDPGFRQPPTALAAQESSRSVDKEHPGSRWSLGCDDKLDGVQATNSTFHLVDLEFSGDELHGSSNEPAPGRSESTTFVGELIRTTDCQLVVLKEVDGEYVRVFQFQSRFVGWLSFGSYVGVWHDNRGRRGDAVLTLTIQPMWWMLR